jgi:phage baseplate assembly protein W
MPDNPHFAFPFRIQGGRANVREQDDPDEIMDAAVAVVGTAPSSRTDIPAFGCKDQAFNPNPNAIRAALDTWEPRASYLVTLSPDLVESLMARVQVEVKAKSNA